MRLVHEKRQHERENLVRCAKVYDRQARRYRPAQTLNVSAGGALLAVRLGEEMKSGQLVDLAIEWGGGGRLVTHGDLIPSQVVRNEGAASDNSVVAVRFNSQQVLSAAA